MKDISRNHTISHFIETKKKSKCSDILNNGYYNGETSSLIDRVPAARLCKKMCDNDTTCLGWAFFAMYEKCLLQSSIDIWKSDKSYKSGSCEGKSTRMAGVFFSFLTCNNTIYASTIFFQNKTTDYCIIWSFIAFTTLKCKEKVSGRAYGGQYGQFNKINTVDECVNMCENSKGCLAWSYNVATKECYIFISITISGTISDAIGGQCYSKYMKSLRNGLIVFELILWVFVRNCDTSMTVEGRVL